MRTFPRGSSPHSFFFSIYKSFRRGNKSNSFEMKGASSYEFLDGGNCKKNYLHSKFSKNEVGLPRKIDSFYFYDHNLISVHRNALFRLHSSNRTFHASSGRRLSDGVLSSEFISSSSTIDTPLGNENEKEVASLDSKIQSESKEESKKGDDAYVHEAYLEHEKLENNEYNYDDDNDSEEDDNDYDNEDENKDDGDGVLEGEEGELDIEIKDLQENGSESNNNNNSNNNDNDTGGRDSEETPSSSSPSSSPPPPPLSSTLYSPRLKRLVDIDTKALEAIERAIVSGHSRMDVHDALHLLPYPHFVPLLGHLRHRKAWKAMLAVLEWMQRQDEASGYRPKAVHYGHVLAALADLEQIDAAFRVFHNMGNVIPNNFHYTPLMHVCCKKGLFPKAEELLERMKVSGTGVSGVQYAVLAQSYAEVGNVPKAMEVFLRMIGSECVPGVGVFTAIIDAFGKSEALEEMEEVWEVMKGKGIETDQRTYNSMAHAYGRMGFIEKMEECYAKMVESGFSHNRISYSCMVSSYARHGLLDRMEHVLFELWNGKWLEVSPIPGVVVTSFLKKGDDKKAFDVLIRMKEHGFTPDSNLLIAILAMMCDPSSPLAMDWKPALRFLDRYDPQGGRVLARLLSSEPNSLDMQRQVREWFDSQDQRCKSQNTKLWSICEWVVEALSMSDQKLRASAVLWDFLLRNVHWGDLREVGGPWRLHLNFMQLNCAELLLMHWISNAQWLAQQGHPIPTVMIIIIGSQKALPGRKEGTESKKKRLSFLLRESIIDKLAQWDAPFFCNEEKNPGLLVAKGVTLEKWLTDPKLVECLNEQVSLSTGVEC